MIREHGPPDATIIVTSSVEGVELDDVTVNEILTMFSEAGEIVLVRLVLLG